MSQTPRFRRGLSEAAEAAVPDLEDLFRIHDVGLEMIHRSHDLDELLDRILDEYERRLKDLPLDALDNRTGPASDTSAKKVRALVMFAAQAAALKGRAEAEGELRRRAQALEGANGRLTAALAEANTLRAQLGGVLAAIDVGLLILGPQGEVRKANRAASALTGVPQGELEGGPATRYLGDVRRGSDGEISLHREGGPRRLLVARRDLEEDGGAEVLVLSDVTDRYREIEERHRLEKLGEVLRTLSVLSHKINNPLTALLGRAQLLQAKRGLDPAVGKAADVIQESSLRIADLIRELARVVKEGRQEAVEQVLRMDDGPAGRETAS